MEGSVWLVDDMECALEIIRLFLEKKGISTALYSCPLKALHDLEQGHIPQLIITDFSMPEMSGAEFLDAVHSMIPGLPAIIITGDPSPIPSRYNHIPIVEKGQINFINDLLTQIQNIEPFILVKKSIRKEKVITKITSPNGGLLTKRCKPKTEKKIAHITKSCAGYNHKPN